jgi:hypothetical protein
MVYLCDSGFWSVKKNKDGRENVKSRKIRMEGKM